MTLIDKRINEARIESPNLAQYVTIETVDGEEITLEKSEYEKMVKDHKQYGEFLY